MTQFLLARKECLPRKTDANVNTSTNLLQERKLQMGV